MGFILLFSNTVLIVGMDLELVILYSAILIIEEISINIDAHQQVEKYLTLYHTIVRILPYKFQNTEYGIYCT